MDCLPSAVLLIGPLGQVVHANLSALQLLAHNDALSLRAGHPLSDCLGWLRASDSASQARLNAAVRHAVSGDFARTPAFTDMVLLRRPGGSSRVLLRTAPLSEVAEFQDRLPRAAALVFLTDKAAVPQLDASALHKLYGLTAAEVRIAQALLRGGTITEVAKGLGITETTAKTHLQRLFQKTETSKQSQLIRLLLDLPSQHIALR